ncbi:hypothetical protein Cni_G23393 [Canna indica]|uniref:non-specific serine/threonine protein kinase n=1 Tax=Canna indica TaxID=4628 RepID=A0AAQ3KTC7_9LILI|nr:hypothetical protein Cni_G23393 [Canna indica]
MSRPDAATLCRRLVTRVGDEVQSPVMTSEELPLSTAGGCDSVGGVGPDPGEMEFLLVNDGSSAQMVSVQVSSASFLSELPAELSSSVPSAASPFSDLTHWSEDAAAAWRLVQEKLLPLLMNQLLASERVALKFYLFMACALLGKEIVVFCRRVWRLVDPAVSNGSSFLSSLPAAVSFPEPLAFSDWVSLRCLNLEPLDMSDVTICLPGSIVDPSPALDSDLLSSASPSDRRRKAFSQRKRNETNGHGNEFFRWLLFPILTPNNFDSDGTNAGFINIDCGIPPNASYPVGNMKYVSDDEFINTGENHDVRRSYTDGLAQRYWTVRSFPQGARNCYTFTSMTPGLKYLIRASFLYGNYDNKNNPWVQFDLYLGVNLWKTLNLTNDPGAFIFTESVSVATSDVMSVCLVNTGYGTPFISGLDVRSIPSTLYPQVNASRSLVLLDRANMAPTGISFIRYPEDPYDRYWSSYDNKAGWNATSTNSIVQNRVDDHFDPPTEVMQDAVYPVNSGKLELTYTSDPGDLNEFYAVMYFSELLKLSNGSRQFSIYLNDAQLNDGKPFTPAYLISDAIYNTNPSVGYSGCNISLVESGSSSLPPLLNALEVLVAMRNENVASDSGDVDAMLAIKEWHQVKKNWMGDPCSPKNYTWDGVNCTSNTSGVPRITAVNLSYSGLTGNISTYFANLSAIQYLDLSHNNLTGGIPDALAFLPSLKLLDLTDNQLSGPIPSALLAKSDNRSIILRTGGNPNICLDAKSCEPKQQKKKIAPYIIVIACVVPALVLFVVTIFLCRSKKKKATGTKPKLQHERNNQFENQKFTYKELENITNNFARIVGKGGFGTVYHGSLEDGTEVAVKMLSQSSQGTKELLAEAQHLTRVHHKNLVSMVGYCMDGDHMALVCEFMSKGTLKEHIKGTHSYIPLSWEQRLKIALEAAQGLEYLHAGCKPPLIHRDVKTTNILLNERLEAKISDFGLSRTFQNDSHSHTSTRVVGTMGYVDPEYYIKNQLSQKSDVYSFGVVLLELITGQPPIVCDPEDTHIVEWVRQKLAKGNIDSVIDASLQQEESIVNSAWKVTNIALACAAHASSKRPSMTDVVVQLRESLVFYNTGDKSQFQDIGKDNLYTESSDLSQVSAIELEHGSISDSEGPSAR